MMSVCKTMKTSELIVLFLVVQAMSQVPELSSTLHSTIYGVQVAYVDETVEFTCVIRESNSMAWSSEEYIGTGGQQLEFLAAERIGSTLTATRNRQTIATLVNTTGSDFIVSRLQITITSNYQTASVQCRNINADTTATITFLLADVISVNCDRQSVCPGETVTCICVTGNSNALNWTTNGNSLAFSFTDPPLTRHNVTGSSIFGVLTESSDRNGIRVIMSNLTFIASMMNVLVCENVDRSTTESIIIPVSGTCTDPTIQMTTSARDNVVATSVGSIVAAVVLPIIFALAALLIVMVVIIVCHKGNKDIKEQHRQQIGTLHQEKDNVKKDLDVKEEEVKELRKQNNKLKRNLGTKGEEVNSLKQAKGDLEIILKDKEKEEKKLRQEKKELKEAKEKAEEDLKEKEEEMNSLETHIQTLKNEIEKLKHPPQGTKEKKRSTNNPPQMAEETEPLLPLEVDDEKHELLVQTSEPSPPTGKSQAKRHGQGSAY